VRRLLTIAAIAGAVSVPVFGIGPARAGSPSIQADDVICLWDVPNQAGGVCLPGLDPITKAVSDLLKSMQSGQAARAFSL
jgi:hypothetical protein